MPSLNICRSVKEENRVKTKFILILALSGVLWGQDLKKPVYADPNIKSASLEVENKILKAENEIAIAKNTQLQAQMQAAQLEQAFNDAQSKEQRATLQLNAAIEQAWSESKLSKDDYDFDTATFKFLLKKKEAKK